MDGALDIAFYSVLSKVHKLDREQTQTNKSTALHLLLFAVTVKHYYRRQGKKMPREKTKQVQLVFHPTTSS
jgi:hypothetical protein